jgi:hypothetical protein
MGLRADTSHVLGLSVCNASRQDQWKWNYLWIIPIISVSDKNGNLLVQRVLVLELKRRQGQFKNSAT